MGVLRRLTVRVFYFLLAVIFLVSLTPSESFADEPISDWFNGQPEVHHNHQYQVDEIPYSIDGNRNCTPQRIVTLPEKILPYPPFYQKEVGHDSCVVSTGYGDVSQSGYLRVAGETVFGRVMYPNGASLILLPVPRSPHGLYMSPHYPTGVKLFKVHNMIEQLTGTTFDSGEKQYRLKAGFTNAALKDRSGNIVGIRREAISFSNSGNWMVTDVPFVGLARINISSFQMQVFDTGFNYFVGSEPGMQSAVSMSGRYVAIGSRSHTRFALYDLDNCTSATTCSKLDLWQYFRTREPSYEGPGRIRFTSEFSMKLYNVSKPNGVRKIESLKLTASGHPPVDFEYLALGDSFASGEGAYQYKAFTDTGNNKCHLSQRSYPYLIADKLSISEMESVACAGAVMEDINTKSEEYEGQVKDKIKLFDRTNKDEIINGFSPGYLPQEHFLAKYNPEVLTLSVLGNDVGFSKKFLRCMEPDTCYSSYEDRLEIVMEVNSKFDDLLELYADIRENMEGKRVYVLGYPSIVAEGGNCALNVHLNAEEIKFANNLAKHLNAVIKAAADKHGYFYVDVEQAMKGQRLCEASSFGVAINGLTAGNDIVDIPLTDFGGPVGNESFHPNRLGHELYKKAVLEKTNDLKAPMPAPNTNAEPPKDLSQIELLEGAPKTNRKLLKVNYDETIGNEVAFRGGWWNGAVEGYKTLNPGMRVFLRSEPVLLGTFTSAADGSLNFSVQIPEDITPGFHTIQVEGESLAGSPMRKEKIIYVAASENDFDGDGIENEYEKCLYGDASGVDMDQDGIDDACDGEIGVAPVSYSDPKPPENNPETVAGHEQTNSEQSVSEALSVNDEEPRDATQSTTSPYFMPATNEQRVEGVQTTTTPVNSVTNSGDMGGKPTSQDNWPVWILPTGLLLVIGVLYPIRKNR